SRGRNRPCPASLRRNRSRAVPPGLSAPGADDDGGGSLTGVNRDESPFARGCARMSGASVSKRVLKSTVAAAAAGVVVFAPLAPHAEGAAPGSGPVEIRVGANTGFTKIEFAGAVGSRARVRQDGRAVIIRIGTTAAPDVSRLKVDPPKGVEKVETRSVQGATELVLTLA